MNRVKKMIKLRNERMSLADIGKRFGISRERVRQLIGNTGRVASKYVSDDDIALMLRLRKEDGLGLDDISKAMGFCKETVAKHLTGVPRFGEGRKWCSKCATVRSKSAFYGSQQICKECSKAQVADYYYEHYAPGREKYEQSVCRIKTQAQIRKLGLRDGRLCTRGDGSCKGRIVAHHPNYKKPNEIVWLCQRHHALVHSGSIPSAWTAEEIFYIVPKKRGIFRRGI